MNTGLNLNAMNKAHAFADRGDDLYETPPEATEALIAAESLPHYIWEPACGRGAISKVLADHGHCVYSSDINDYGFGVGGVDFLSIKQRRVDVEAIVTNPPYRLAQKFVEHALFHAPKVVMLLRLAFLESERRTPILEGGKLQTVFVFRNRLPFMHRDGWDGNKVSSAVAFAWFVWSNCHQGPPCIKRISWGKQDEIRTV